MVSEKIDVANKKYDVVFLWKQNDSGLYGRRADMMLKGLAESDWVENIVEFDAPIDIDVLENYQNIIQQKDNTHYGLIYDNTIKAYLGNKDIYGVKAYTYIYSKRGSNHKNYSTMDYYFDYVRKVLDLNGIGLKNDILLWNCPINYELENWINFLKPSYIISDIIDDQRAWSSNKNSIQKMTDNYLYALKVSDFCMVNCQEMYDRVCGMSAEAKDKTELIPNGCEGFCNDEREKPELLKELKGPIIGQVSNLEKKIDVELLEKCAQLHPEWNIVLIGSTHSSDDTKRLEGYKNIYLTGPIPYETAKNYIANFDVAMIAHRIVNINKAMNPLKLYVYCSLGASVVSTNIPGIDDLKDVIWTADSHDEFIAKIEDALQNPHIYENSDIELVNKYSWTRKVEQIHHRIITTESSRKEVVSSQESTSFARKEEPLSFKRRVKNFVYRLPGVKSIYWRWRQNYEAVKKLEDRIARNVRSINELKRNQKFDSLESEIEILKNQVYACNEKLITYKNMIQMQGNGEALDNVKITVIMHYDRMFSGLSACVDNILKKAGYDNIESIVLLSSSEEQEYSFEETVKVEWITETATYGERVNQLVAETQGKYVVFLNNVHQMSLNWLQGMFLHANILNDVGVIGAQLHLKNRTLFNGNKIYDIGKVQFTDYLCEDGHYVVPEFIIEEEINYSNAVQTPCVWGACMMFAKQAFLEAGGLDVQYAEGYDGMDLSLKLHRLGYKSYVATDVLGLYSLSEEREQKAYIQFCGRWQSYLTREIFSEKLKGKSLFSMQKLTIGVINKYNNENSFNAFIRDCKKGVIDNELARFIKACIYKGFEISYIPGNLENGYNVGTKVDVLLIVDTFVFEEKLQDIKNDVYRMYWIQKEQNFNLSMAELMQCELAFCEEKGCIYELKGNAYDAVNFESETMADTVFKLLGERNIWHMDEKSIDIMGCMPKDDKRFNWGDYYYALSMKKEFEKHGFNVHVKSYPEWLEKSNSKYVLMLRGIRPYYPKIEGQVNIMWNISHPDDVSLDEYNQYDLVYIASERLHESLDEKIKVLHKSLLQCTDEKIMNYTENDEKKYELLFIGNSRGVFRKIIQDLLPTKHKLTIYGRAWEKYVPKECIAGQHFDNEKVGQAYHDAKILLNDHWDDMREQGIISNRIFDALAVEAFVISDNIPEITDVFEGAVITYEDKEDLRTKIDFYLSHPEERKEKALLGQKIVLEKHTFRNRVETIIDDINTYQL